MNSLQIPPRTLTLLHHTSDIVQAMLTAGQLNASKPEGDASTVAQAVRTIYATLSDLAKG